MLIDKLVHEGAETSTTRKLQAHAAQIASNVREVSHRLHPSIIADLGLSVALSSLVDQAKSSGQDVSFTERGVAVDVSLQTATALYRIAQEGLRNAAKHAPKAAVKITLTLGHRELQLSIKDNGPGFSPVQAQGTGGLGLISMQERARLVGGSLLLSTRPGEGTLLFFRVPLGA